MVENELVNVVEALTTLGVLVTVTILSGAVNKLVMVVVGVWVKLATVSMNFVLVLVKTGGVDVAVNMTVCHHNQHEHCHRLDNQHSQYRNA